MTIVAEGKRSQLAAVPGSLTLSLSGPSAPMPLQQDVLLRCMMTQVCPSPWASREAAKDCTGLRLARSYQWLCTICIEPTWDR